MMTSYKKFRLAIVIAVILLVTSIIVALLQFYQLEKHLIGHEVDFSIAMAIIHDARAWLLVMLFIAIIFIMTMIAVLANAYIKPHRDRHRMHNKIMHALSQNEFELVYQPQINLQSQQIISAESLLRWSHPKKGMISPDRFMQLAEQTSSIMPLGAWIIETACAQYKTWREKGLVLKKIAVNVSASQLKSDLLIQQIKHALATYQIPASCLEIEVTESAMMADMKTSIHYLQQIHDLGVLIALDDFGTGHASLQYVKKLPVHLLKIDRAFVMHCHEDAADRAILKMIIDMAHSLHLKVIAEGVENQQQLDVLSELGCDEVQGYLIAKPLSVDAFEDLYTRHNQPL
jgi:EAL domain-containing protein (putative c-di-GMP-specific phosphodiesterase class I)